jgi:hypothetical protein
VRLWVVVALRIVVAAVVAVVVALRIVVVAVGILPFFIPPR